MSSEIYKKYPPCYGDVKVAANGQKVNVRTFNTNN